VNNRLLQKIRDTILKGEYDVSIHAIEEMAEDGLDILDVESAILNGELTKIETDDPRGERYTIKGQGVNEQRTVGVVGRFTETGIYLLITVYEAIE
jgi:hypothetical protein